MMSMNGGPSSLSKKKKKGFGYGYVWLPKNNTADEIYIAHLEGQRKQQNRRRRKGSDGASLKIHSKIQSIPQRG